MQQHSARAILALGIGLTAGLGLTGRAAGQSAPVVPGNSPAAKPPAVRLRSRIFLYDLRDGSSKLLYTADDVWEAPSWSPDGSYLITNSGGGIYRIDVRGGGPGTPVRLPIGAEYRCNNDKAISPDGKLLGFSATLAPSRSSNVYVASVDGTGIRALTSVTPSYFHGWSPDGKVMAFVGQRNGNPDFDVYRVPAAGGPEETLASAPHHNDGPDYSPDGRWIYINSDRTGHQSIWRIPPEGAGPNDSRAEMVLADGAEDWFPHVSPDGKKLVYIAYPAGTATHNPRDVSVSVRMSSIANGVVDKQPKTLVTFTGGQGSLNVNSWAPDSQRFAYVSYEALP